MGVHDFESYTELYSNLQIGSKDAYQWDPPKPAKQMPLPPPPSQPSNTPKQRPLDGGIHFTATMTRRPTPFPPSDKVVKQESQPSPPALLSPAPANGLPPPAAPTGPAVPPHPASTPMTGPQLLYHTLHLATILTDSLSTYLSLEVLLRDLSTQGRGYFNLAQALSNTGAMLSELGGVISGAHADLAKYPEHSKWLEEDCYKTLMCAVPTLRDATGCVPDARVPGTFLPSKEKLVTIQRLWCEAKALREGKKEGEVGWMKCWDLFSYLPMPPLGP
ncbi:Hypothetical predicted protein [Lecanosticta acicola]|uniref:Uncharacterized protein n=1 Tax=Lecanosticta acicola TaxID=111012 RepID=A0AAI8YYB0_9PEZI|nr:Hypothetical predicted protein [Lecanosticta acicola]